MPLEMKLVSNWKDKSHLKIELTDELEVGRRVTKSFSMAKRQNWEINIRFGHSASSQIFRKPFSGRKGTSLYGGSWCTLDWNWMLQVSFQKKILERRRGGESKEVRKIPVSAFYFGGTSRSESSGGVRCRYEVHPYCERMQHADPRCQKLVDWNGFVLKTHVWYYQHSADFLT